MRRNIVKKLCANHYLTQNQTLLAQIRSPNTWIWYAKDFSDPSVPKVEQFCAKFDKLQDSGCFYDVFLKSVRFLGDESAKFDAQFFLTPEKTGDLVGKMCFLSKPKINEVCQDITKNCESVNIEKYIAAPKCQGVQQCISFIKSRLKALLWFPGKNLSLVNFALLNILLIPRNLEQG